MRLLAILLSLALPVSAQAGEPRGFLLDAIDAGGLHPSGAQLHLDDDIMQSFGGTRTVWDAQWEWDTGAATDNFRLTLTDVDGIGTNGVAIYWNTGTDDAVMSGGLTLNDTLSLSDGNITNVGDIALDSLTAEATSGGITMGGTGATSAESLLWRYGETANTVNVTTATGVLTVDWGSLLIAAGGYDAGGGDLTNIDWLYSDAITSDAAPNVLVLGAQPIVVTPGATSVTGANVVLAPSPGERTLDGVTKAGTAADTLTITMFINGVAQTPRVLTADTDWVCSGAADDATCVCNLYDYLIANPEPGMTVTRSVVGDCSDEKLTFSITPGEAEYLTLVSSDDVNLDITVGADGQVLASTYGSSTAPAYSFAEDPTTGVYGSFVNLNIAANGAGISRFNVGGLTMFSGDIQGTAAGKFIATGRSRWGSSADHLVEETNAAGQGWRKNFTADSVVALTDEAGGALTLSVANRTGTNYRSLNQTSGMIMEVQGGSSAFDGGDISIKTGNRTNTGDHASGTITYCQTGDTTTDGLTGNCVATTGASGDGTGVDAGDHIWNVNGAIEAMRIDGYTGALTLAQPPVFAGYTRHHDVPIGAAIVGAAAPGQETIGTFRCYVFDANADLAHVSVEVPSEWNGSSDMAIDLLIFTDNGDALGNGEVIEFDLVYRSVDEGQAYDNGAAVTIEATVTGGGAETDKGQYKISATVDYDDTDQPLAVNDTLGFSIMRDVDDSDTYSGDVHVCRAQLVYTANALATH